MSAVTRLEPFIKYGSEIIQRVINSRAKIISEKREKNNWSCDKVHSVFVVKVGREFLAGAFIFTSLGLEGPPETPRT